MKAVRVWAVLVMWVAAVPPAGAQASAGDARIVAAREALRSGDGATLDQLAASQSPHVLARYIDYWRLHHVLARAEAPDGGEIEAFVARYPGTVLAERLRAAWLARLAKDENWIAFIGAWGGLADPDDGLRCLHWQARLAIGDRAALDEVAAQWQALSTREAACTTVIGQLAAAGRLDSEALWQRFRRQMEARRPRGAETTLGWLPAEAIPEPALLTALLKDPERYLENLTPGFERSRTTRELALAALGQVARSDPRAAYMRFVRISEHFPPDERAFAYVLLGWRGAQDHLPQALPWYRAAGDVPMTDEQYAWQVRAALRSGDWSAVRRAVLGMPAAQRAADVWTYWLARAEQALGEGAAAEALFARVAGAPDFYGMLADEALGRQFAPPAAAAMSAAMPAATLADVEDDPAIRRALALFRLDLRTEAVREWNWRLRDASDEFKLAAAQVALRHDVYDRAINTAEAVDSRGNYALRFITPYRTLIEPQARAQGLDVSWVYGLMRQESRFVSYAASHAGAQGLMQVMPATGKWVARKIGFDGYRRSVLQDPETNVLLGTSYMRIVLDDLDNHPVLASAGYNAGPGRAKRWRDARPLEGAIYVETIPFDETRHYVKKVMANAVIYGALMEGRAQSLRARLGSIDPALAP